MNNKFLSVIIALNAISLVLNGIVIFLKGKNPSVLSIVSIAFSLVALSIWILIARKSKSKISEEK